MLVAIDGPAGAGKSTVARAVAAALGFTYLDTGAMYRVVALAETRGRTHDEIEIGFDDDGHVTMCGEDVSALIRTPEISAGASRVASRAEVREALVSIQREIISRGDYVAEGRDIATVVAPDAEVKVFMTASAAERARRRAAELGIEDVAAVERDITARDAGDTGHGRTTNAAAAGVTEIDTTGLTIDEVVAEIVALAGGSRA